LIFDFDFGELAIKGRSSRGNILTRNAVHKITLKEKGVSTLGGRKLWFDDSVYRLNADSRGEYLGEFSSDDKILVITKEGRYRMSNFDLSNHFEDNILLIEKYRSNIVYSAIYWDAEQEFYYLKRFNLEETEKTVSIIGDDAGSKLISLTEVEYPRFEIKFGGKHKDREKEIIEVAEFIGVKSYKARGKRLTNYSVDNIKEIEPVIRKETQKQFDEPGDEDSEKDGKNIPSDPSQMSLFSD